MIKNLPVYEAFLGDQIGIFTVALVDEPAMEKYWAVFSKEEEPKVEKLNFKVVDEEQHKVLSVLIRCDYPILRKDDNGEYFYLTFSKETIYAAAENFLKNGFQNIIRLTHQGDNYIEDGFNLVQFYIKDSTKGINPEGFEDIADGSLMCEYFVTDDALWDEIKAGTFNGISMESVFEIAPKKEEDKEINSIEELLNYLNIK